MAVTLFIYARVRVQHSWAACGELIVQLLSALEVWRYRALASAVESVRRPGWSMLLNAITVGLRARGLETLGATCSHQDLVWLKHTHAIEILVDARSSLHCSAISRFLDTRRAIFLSAAHFH